ncbi:hypothetical protein M8A51_18795 [Schlegelella sp. S2-27]|uniref:Acyl carrier protein n=2 Tax=Caldimonas mangrovi TaxID=2944811 RepID=A0ABT0YS51_9BURK|nr:hypothetical protein [Caldimonas mangrovi]
MPKFTRRAAGPAWWLLLSLLGASVAYVAIAEPKTFVSVVAVLTVLFALAHLQGKREERKLLALAAARKGQTICEFARDFDARAVDTWIIRAVYEQLQAQLEPMHPAFPVRAEDRLKEDLLLDDDDLDVDLVQEVEARTGRSLDGSTDNPYFGNVKTVRDLVLFFQSQPRSSRAT